VVLTTVWKQEKMGEVQEGDQVRPGVPFMQVVDPSRMQVRVLANQEDFLGLQIGQLSKVHLDAYPELVFPGKLEEMAPIGRRTGDFSSRLRTFAVFSQSWGSDARLMPDLSAALDVDLAQHHECCRECAMITRIRQFWIHRKVAVVVTLLLGCGGVLGAVRYTNHSPAVPTFEVKRGELSIRSSLGGK